MSFQVGKKILIVNDPAQAALLFYAKLASGVRNLVETDDDFQSVTPFDELATSPDTGPDAEGPAFLPADVSTDETVAQADMLRIAGFGDFIGSDIIEVIGTKGVPGAKQVSTITLGALNPIMGQELIIDLNFSSDSNRGEFASHISDYKRLRSFNLPIKPGETIATLASRLVVQIQSAIDSGWVSWVSATSAAGVITLTSTDETITFTATARGSAIDFANVTFAFATTVLGYSGRNTYNQMKAIRLETNLGEYVEEFKSKQVPIKGVKYSSYVIRKTVTRPDLLGGYAGGMNNVPTGTFEFMLYINETTAQSYITNLVKWLNANVAKRTMYAATTAIAAAASEVPIVTSAVDNTEPFTTGLS